MMEEEDGIYRRREDVSSVASNAEMTRGVQAEEAVRKSPLKSEQISNASGAI